MFLCLDGEPYFIAANSITIPKRLNIAQEVVKYYNKPSGYGSLEARLRKELDKL